ncbi:hypothetical protein [Mucilaginibacter sp.]|nr:hypothetical protein [Mucilaginibacter sp.]
MKTPLASNRTTYLVLLDIINTEYSDAAVVFGFAPSRSLCRNKLSKGCK